jgi:hypothetical protein
LILLKINYSFLLPNCIFLFIFVAEALPKFLIYKIGQQIGENMTHIDTPRHIKA